MKHNTPKNQLTKEVARKLFVYRDDKLYWKENGQGKQLDKPIGWKWKNGYWYADLKLENETKWKHYGLHSLVYNYHYGLVPDGKCVDHIDRNKDNNTIDNLRLVTNQENSFNTNISKNNTSGHTGVYWHKRDKRWLARITIDGKTISLGRFKTIEKAIKARKLGEEKYFKIG